MRARGVRYLYALLSGLGTIANVILWITATNTQACGFEAALGSAEIGAILGCFIFVPLSGFVGWLGYKYQHRALIVVVSLLVAAVAVVVGVAIGTPHVHPEVCTL